MDDATAPSPDLAAPPAISVATAPAREGTIFRVLFAISFCHLLNDMIQSLVPAIYPILKSSYALSFAQIGLITLAFQLTASLLQPLVGIAADRRPLPYSLAVGMGFTLAGLLLLAHADGFGLILIAAALIGSGSSVFHPESSRVARMASGGRFGLAQSVFQVGGNTGSALGPLLAAFIVLPHGQGSIAWFSAAALLAIAVLAGVGRWSRRPGAGRAAQARGARRRAGAVAAPYRRRHRGSSAADLLEIFLSRQPEQLLYLLPDREVSPLGAGRADPPVHLHGRGRDRHPAGRPDRRPDRAEIRHLGLDPGRAAVHPDAALGESVLDRRAERRDRAGAGLGLRGDPGLCDRS